MRSYARYWQEAFRLPRLSRERIVADTVSTGVEHMERARADGRGVVFALPHSGNWDAAGVWLVDFLGGPFMTVVERLRPESLYRRVLAFPGRPGRRAAPPSRGARPGAAGGGGG